MSLVVVFMSLVMVFIFIYIFDFGISFVMGIIVFFILIHF